MDDIQVANLIGHYVFLFLMTITTITVLILFARATKEQMMNLPKREVYKIQWEAPWSITYKEAVQIYLTKNKMFYSSDVEKEFIFRFNKGMKHG